MKDLRELLKAGCRVTFKNGTEEYINNKERESANREMHGEDLKFKHWDDSAHDIVEIYRPKYNGIHTIGNPQWELVWERKEPKYCLKVKDRTLAKAFNGEYLNYISKRKHYFFGRGSEDDYFQTRFTRSEIEQIPQALRDLCEEVEV